MADDEQFSLCWNNFNSNLSAGFHESLCRGDLVDVTLAAEGQFVKAHRLVLSVCSPYFRKMFTQMPANQHAFVFLKDVSHSALKDLIQFMYCGEVNVKQEALPAFISTAEALQIKGLTDSDPPQSQSPPEPSTPTPQVQQIATSPRVRQRTTTSRSSYKLESLEDPSPEDHKPQPTQIVIQTSAAAPQTATIVHHAAPQQHHMQSAQTQIVTAAPATATTTVLTHKRPAQRNIGAPHIKRTKSTIETIDATEQQTTVQPQQITVQTAVVTTDKGHQPAETEYIDLPIELPTKSEPEYSEEAGEVVESGDQETTYVEDDSFGDIRYDESYFTENEDGGPTTVTNTSSVNSQSSAPTTSKALVKQQPSSFSESSYVESGTGTGDQSNSEAQGVVIAQAVVQLSSLKLPKKRTTFPLNIEATIEKNREKGVPATYASTIKGPMKLIYEGHYFNYSFRKGPYTVFTCRFRDSQQKCPVKIVIAQNLVYPLEGEHSHFMKATDKSVTPYKIRNINQKVLEDSASTQQQTVDECTDGFSMSQDNYSIGMIQDNQSTNETEQYVESSLNQVTVTNIKLEDYAAPSNIDDNINEVMHLTLPPATASITPAYSFSSDTSLPSSSCEESKIILNLQSSPVVEPNKTSQDSVASLNDAVEDPAMRKKKANDFREKMQKRLTKALLQRTLSKK